MAYTTIAIANRLGINQGWHNSLIPQNIHISDTEQLTYLKSYLLLQEYLRFYQTNLLFYEIKWINSYKKIFNIVIYKHIPYRRIKEARKNDWQIWKKNALFKLIQVKSQKKLPIPFNITKQQLTKVRYRNGGKQLQQKILLRLSNYRMKKSQLYELMVLYDVINKISIRRRALTYCKYWPSRLMLINKLFSAKRIKYNDKVRFCIRRKLPRKNLNNWSKSLRLLSHKIYITNRWSVLKNKNLRQKKLNRSYYIPKIKTNQIPHTTYCFKNIKNRKYLWNLTPPPTKFHQLEFNPELNILSRQFRGELLRSITHKKIIKSQLQYFFGAYIKQWLGINAMVKINTPISIVYQAILFNKFKNQITLKRWSSRNFFKRLLFVFINGQRHINPQLFADLIASELVLLRKKHKRALNEISKMFDLLRPNFIKSYKIVVTGKLDDKDRTEKIIVKRKGKELLPAQQFDKRINYALSVSRTYTGLFGVKVWLYY